MDYPIDLGFNSQPSRLMHLDLNSCFASIEQQANPLLRRKPLAICAYDSPGGCILAASLEAKKLGIGTGMRVKEARVLCPDLIVKIPDPDKYRHVHRDLRKIISRHTPYFFPKSIDEFILDFSKLPFKKDLRQVGRAIKAEIKNQVGEMVTVSIGLGPNRFLAKTASNLKKPDGLEEINYQNFYQVYSGLKLRDLTGINFRNEARLRRFGIGSVIDFYEAPLVKLKAAFASIQGYYWFLRLRGWEIDDFESQRRSFGNSYALPHSQGNLKELLPILSRLTEKTGSRMRVGGYLSFGVGVSLFFRDRSHWQKSQKLVEGIFDSRDIYQKVRYLLTTCPKIKPVHTLSVWCFSLESLQTNQLDLFGEVVRKRSLTGAIDQVNTRWGNLIVGSAKGFQEEKRIQDRIAFGGVREIGG